MHSSRLTQPRYMAVLLLVLIIAVVSSAFASQITMPTDISAAEGSGVSNDYNITDVAYDINLTSTTIDTVTLTFATSPAGDVYVQVQDGTAGYSSAVQCTGSGPFTCDVSGANQSVSGYSGLRVFAGGGTLTVTP